MSTCLMHSDLSTAKHWKTFMIFSILPQKFFLQIWHKGSLVCTLDICKNLISILIRNAISEKKKVLLSATKFKFTTVR